MSIRIRRLSLNAALKYAKIDTCKWEREIAEIILVYENIHSVAIELYYDDCSDKYYI